MQDSEDWLVLSREWGNEVPYIPPIYMFPLRDYVGFPPFPTKTHGQECDPVVC